MSVSTSSLHRPLSQAGFIAVALVAAPAVHGQDGAHAMLNHLSGPAGGLAVSDGPAASVTGERALLGRIDGGSVPTVSQFELLASDTVVDVIDGARALMARPATPQGRRSIVTKSE